MFENIRLKFGSSSNQPNLEISSASLTIFVGPNNSGKSQVLRDIFFFCQSGVTQGNILESIVISPIKDIENAITKHTLKPFPHETLNNGLNIIFGKRGFRHNVNLEMLRNLFTNPNINSKQFSNLFLSFNVIPLDGAARLLMINPENAGDLKNPVNKLPVLFTDENKRKEVRKIVFDAFNKYLTLDPTQNGQLSIKLSEIEPLSSIERSLSDEAIEYHRNNLPIESTSDGVKAFIGIIISIIADDPQIMTIDEPEAFLHPSLSSKLGKEVGNILKKDLSKKVFAATHSSNFLMGCVQSGVSINIVRLTYSNNVPTARILSSEKIVKLMRNPLLRSVDALQGLFYEYVIVTESDSDRAFYQEINERLLAFSPEKGIPNCLFLNAQNKQTVHEIIKPLREMGIPCAAIVDVDVIKEGGTVWTNLVESGFVPEVTKRETDISRSCLYSKIKEIDAEKGVKDFFKRNGGVDVLEKMDKEACNNLFDRLDEYGIFVVRSGELESWLKHLGVTNKYKWLIEIFEKMGEDPNCEHYLKPVEGDVWNFIAKIKGWFINSNRKGIPE